MDKTLILIQCKDEVGLVSLITKALADQNLNITTMREFVDEAANRFFARIDCLGEIFDSEKLKSELLNILPLNADVVIDPKKVKQIAVLATKEYHCLADTLVRNYFDTLGAKVCCVASNYNLLQSFTGKFDIPYYYIDHESRTREQFEAELMQVIDSHDLDYIILAKFMRILSPVFVERYANKIINIHHSFLPAFVGAHPYRQAYERGVKLIGATAHFVTNDLDEGPIIAQQTIPVNHTFGTSEMVVAGKEIEKAVLSKAMRLVFQDRVFISGNRTIIFE